MAEEMTASTRRAFLASGTRTAILATTRPDGRPHAVPIAFVLDNDDVLFVTDQDSVKGRAVQRDPRVTLVVDDETPPFAFVMIEGTAQLSRSPNDIETIAPKISERYDGPDAGPDAVEDFVRFARDQLGLLVRVRPSRMLALNRVSEH
jgi:PPOX class probable F420-dependent enzyme